VPSLAATDAAPDEPERASAAPAASVRRHSRWRPWLVLLTIAFALQLTITLFVAPFAGRRLSRLLGTRVDVGSVSFAPLDGVVTLRNVVVHSVAEDASPTLSAERVQLDMQWLPLLHRALLLRELRVDSARVDVDRVQGGGWTLERVQRLHPETELPPGWSFALDRVVVHDTTVRLGGAAAEDAQTPDIVIREARAETQRRRASAFGRVPNLRIDAVVGDGRLFVDGSSDIRDEGVAVTARVYAKRLPLRPFVAHRTALVSESPVTGRVSARLQYQRDPGRRDRLTGRLGGRHLTVRVPTLDAPALAVRRAEAELVEIDLLQRRISTAAVALHGAALEVRPDLMAPVPLLDGLARTGTARATAPASERRPDTWSWTIGHLEAPAARLLAGEAGAEHALTASLSGDNLSPSAYWSPVRAAIGWEGGTAAFDGVLRMTRGFAIDGRLTASDLPAAMVSSAVDPSLAALVRDGRVAVDLDVDLAPGTTDGPPLGVQGSISIQDLRVAAEDPDLFTFGARALELTQARIVPARHGSPSLAVVEVGAASVTAPDLRLKRTAEGWARGTQPEEVGPQPQEPAGPSVALAVASMSVRDGRLSIIDESAEPPLSLDVSALAGSVRDVRLPGATITDFDVEGRDLRLGSLRVAATRSGGERRFELSATDVDLAAAAPYFQRAGLPYAFSDGRGSVHALVQLAGARWTADTTLRLIDPALSGDQGALERSLGTAPAAAFRAVHDRHGEVMLRFPLASEKADAQGVAEALALGVRDALARPPWVLLPETPIPIRFAPGRAEPGPDTPRQLEAIAKILAARPDALLDLRGLISGVDRRWFAEQELAADWPDDPGGLKALLRAVGVRDQRERIREALWERGAGRPAPLNDDDEAALDALVATRPPIPDERIAMLASTRAALVARLLAERHGVVAARVDAGEPGTADGPGPVVVARFLPSPGLSPR